MSHKQSTDEIRGCWVQSCISVITFPDVFEELEHFLIFDEGSEEVVGWQTDIDLLLDPDEEFSWTAPRWITEGDVLFFYHAKIAKRSIARLLKEAKGIAEAMRNETGPRSSRRDGQDLRSVEKIVRLLEHAAKQAELYAGCIFACGEVSGPTEYYDDEVERHFSNRHFAPIGRVHEFGEPLQADRFAEFVKIGQATPNTPLYEPQFEGLKGQLIHTESRDFSGTCPLVCLISLVFRWCISFGLSLRAVHVHGRLWPCLLPAGVRG